MKVEGAVVRLGVGGNFISVKISSVSCIAVN